MNYIKIYDSLIDRAKQRTAISYVERHHIIPKCLGGSDELDNLVDLTPEEHYLAHQLLVKIHPNDYRLALAAHMMTSNRPSNKLYGWLRRRHSNAMSIVQSGAKNSQYGTRWIHIDMNTSKKIPKDEPLPIGWCEGRSVRKTIKCAFCGAACLQPSSKFCSSKCLTYSRSPAIYIIDTHVEEMVAQFTSVKSITKVLSFFGIEGRQGNSYFSSILKSRGLEVLKRRNS